MGSPEGQPATFTDAQLDAARRYFVDSVRALGPAPTLRAGRQPYGVLPGHVARALPAGAGRAGPLRRQPALPARRVEGGASGRAAARAGGDPDALVEVLRLQPASVGYSARLAFDSQFFAPTTVFASQLSPHLQGHANVIRARLQPATTGGLVAQERFFDLIPADVSRPLRGAARDARRRAAGPAARRELHLVPAHGDLRRPHQRALPGRLPAEGADGRAALPPPAALGAARLRQRRAADPRPQGRCSTRASASRRSSTSSAGRCRTTTPTLIRALLKTGLGANIHTLGKAQEPEAAELDELRASLRYLEALPVDALERQLRGCIDLFAYRLDAWITSLATRRLGELRAKAPRALVLGAFGWVHDLKASPRATVPAPAGRDRRALRGARAGRLPPRAVAGAGLGRGRAPQRLPRAHGRGRLGPARDQPLVVARARGRVAARRGAPGAAARLAARLPLRARPARAAARPLHRGLPADLAARPRLPGEAGPRPAARRHRLPAAEAGEGAAGPRWRPS